MRPMFSPAATHAKPVQNPVLGVFWMIVTGLCFVGVTVTVKIVGTEVPPSQAGFLRYLLGLIFFVPMLPSLMRLRLSRRAWSLIGGRGAAQTVGVICWFYAMTQIPIAEVTAMNYLNPIYVTLLAALFLGERLAFRRMAAIGVALIGAMLILRPGFREVSPGHIAMLFTAVAFAVSYLMMKVLTEEISAATVVAMLSITCTIGLAPFAWAVWVPVGWEELGWLALVAGFATGGHYAMTLAFRVAPLAVTQPVTFLQLVWAAAIGAAFFAEPVDPWVVAGGTLILGAVSFITWREAMLRRGKLTPAVEQTKA